MANVEMMNQINRFLFIDRSVVFTRSEFVSYSTIDYLVDDITDIRAWLNLFLIVGYRVVFATEWINSREKFMNN